MNCRKCQRDIPAGSAFCNHCGTNQTEPVKQYKRRGNGLGTVYKRGKTWTAYVSYFGRGKRESKTKGGFRTRTEALQALPNMRDELERGIRAVKPRMETLKTLHETWSKVHKPKISSARAATYATAWKRLDKIADVGISQLTIGDLQNIVNKRADTYHTANGMKQMLSQLYTLAAAQGDVASNLAQYILLPPKVTNEAAPFNSEEINTLWLRYKAGELFPAYVLLMIYTGMMPGELMLAEKNMIDWEERTILGCGLKTNERKTKPIVFPEVITPVLERIVQQAKKEKLLDCGRNAFYERFRKMVSDFGFRRELTAYSCRHTTANTLAMSYENIPNAAIQAVMRQRSFDSTQHYIHPDTITARNTIDRASHEFHDTSNKESDMVLKENIPQRDGSKKHRKKRLT